jgi:hypothetical protein
LQGKNRLIGGFWGLYAKRNKLLGRHGFREHFGMGTHGGNGLAVLFGGNDDKFPGTPAMGRRSFESGP